MHVKRRPIHATARPWAPKPGESPIGHILTHEGPRTVIRGDWIVEESNGNTFVLTEHMFQYYYQPRSSLWENRMYVVIGFAAACVAMYCGLVVFAAALSWIK